MSKQVKMKFQIVQDPGDHPKVNRGIHTIIGSSIDDCWEQIQDKARNICTDEFSINLIMGEDE